jgi:hypothetical protein
MILMVNANGSKLLFFDPDELVSDLFPLTVSALELYS